MCVLREGRHRRQQGYACKPNFHCVFMVVRGVRGGRPRYIGRVVL
jgi:hypothetical protein